jgi:hypothetical protein
MSGEPSLHLPFRPDVGLGSLRFRSAMVLPCWSCKEGVPHGDICDWLAALPFDSALLGGPDKGFGLTPDDWRNRPDNNPSSASNCPSATSLLTTFTVDSRRRLDDDPSSADCSSDNSLDPFEEAEIF